MRTRRCLAAAIAVAVMLASPAAVAQGRGGWMPKKQGHRLGAQLEVWPSENFLIMTGEFVAQIEVLDELMIDFSAPSAYGSSDFGPIDAFILGNPSAGAHWADFITPAFALWAGGRVTFPILLDPNGERTFVAGAAAINRGFFDYDRFAIEYLTIRPQIGLEVHFARLFFFRTDFGLPLSVPVGDRADDAEFFVEHGNEFEVRAPIGVGGGVRLQFFVAASDPVIGNDRFQAAIEPYFVYEPFGRAGFFARVGGLIALDEPLGFGFDQNNLATIRVTLGGKW